MSRIEMENLSVRYGRRRSVEALKEISLELEGPALVGILGRNGSGKTTWMRTVAGVVVPSSGHVRIDGEEPSENLEVLRRVVYEEPNLARLEKQKLDGFLADYRELYPDFDEEFARGILDLFGIPVGRQYGELSHGMRSLFNFACGLAVRAEVTLLDEPVSGMDVTVRRKVYEIILRDYIEHPRLILLSSHMASEMEKMFSHILLLEKGQAVFFGEMEEAGEQAYEAEGKQADLDAFCRSRDVMSRTDGELSSRAVIEGPLTGEVKDAAARMGIRLSRVNAIEYCFQKINPDRGKELEHLWEK